RRAAGAVAVRRRRAAFGRAPRGKRDARRLLLESPDLRGRRLPGGRPLLKGDSMAQRVVIGMYDGLGTDYVRASRMPVFKEMQSSGFSKTVSAVMPSVTNANNASIACSAWPEEHGITGNSYFDEQAETDVYMESADS